MAHPKPASPNEPKSATESAPAAKDSGHNTNTSLDSLDRTGPDVLVPESTANSTESEAAAATSSPMAAKSDAIESTNKTTAPSAEEETATPATAAAVESTESATCVVPVPTYASTRSSAAYAHAKSLLTTGQFELALQSIEQIMADTRASILSHQSSSNTGNVIDVFGQEQPNEPSTEKNADEVDESHPALAPLYYLYGTTLLYSVEESDDMVNQGAAQQGGGVTEETAEDLQIAWENLDLARSILSRMVKEPELALASESDNNTDPEAAEAREKVLDLAQIHLRLADLQKANGAYREGLDDYAQALQLRRTVLGKYDRKVADVHYQLGVTCMMLAAEGDKTDGEGVSAPGGNAAAAGAGAGGLLPPGAEEGILGMMSAAASEAAESAKPTTEECAELRKRSVRHYLACGKSFGGCVAQLLGAAVTEIVGEDGAEEEEGEEVLAGDKKPAAAEDAKEGESSPSKAEHEAYVSASKTLAAIRAKCADLANAKPSSASTSTTPPSADDMEVVADLLEVLDELQETIDSQEQDLGGIQQVHEMKAQIEEDVKAADANPFGTATASAASSATHADGSTTTIGFGAASASTSAAAASAATTTTTTAAAEPARPMMVIKKKKKRAALTTVTTGTDGAMSAAASATAEPDAKRPKSE